MINMNNYRSRSRHADGMALNVFVAHAENDQRTLSVHGLQSCKRHDSPGADSFLPHRGVGAFRPRPPFGIWTWGNDANSTTDAMGESRCPSLFRQRGCLRCVSPLQTSRVRVADTPISTSQFSLSRRADGAKFQATANAQGDVVDFSYNFVDAFTPQHWSLAEDSRHGFDFCDGKSDPRRDRSAAESRRSSPGLSLPFTISSSRALISMNAQCMEDLRFCTSTGIFWSIMLGSFAPIPSSHDGCTARDAFGGLSIARACLDGGLRDSFAMAAASSLPPGTLQGHPGDFGTFSLTDLGEYPLDRADTGLSFNVTPP